MDALRVAREREILPTSLDTAGLRQLDSALRARGVFVARGTNAAYLTKLKEVVDGLAQGDIGEADARLALLETLRALGYTPEGGFPDDPPGKVPSAVKGTLQDLSSFRRLDLIVRTQVDLMRGAGQQLAGHSPDRLEAAPAWELIRIEDREVPRDWPKRWTDMGGELIGGKMIAFKGDPIWGEIGSSENFPDALDVDYPPFAFNSGMGWREVTAEEARRLNVKGPLGETADEFFRGPSRPVTISGELPLPSPGLSAADIDEQLAAEFLASTGATETEEGTFDYSDILADELASAARAYEAKHQKGGQP